MARKHNSNTAQQYLNLIDQTKAKPDLEICFAVGTIGTGKSERVVVLFANKSISSLPNSLKIMDYKEKKDKDYQEAKNFSLMRKGTGRLNGQGKFVVRLARGGNAGFTTVEKKIKEYFKDIGKRGAFPDMELQQDAGELTEEEINAFEIRAEKNDKYFTGGEKDGSGQQATAAESPAAGETGEADSDTESVVFTPTASEAGDDDVPEEDPMEGVEDSNSEDKEGDDKPLSDELKQGIATASSTIAGHAISLSRQIGAGQKAELGPLTDKITAWLEDMLAALLPEEREMALHNFTSRLLLMLAYPENLRNLQYVDATPAAADGEQDKPGREKLLVNGVDLDNVSTEDLTQEEVTQSLFKLAKAEAMKRQLPYPLNQASPDRIAGMVVSGWPRAEDDAAGKRKAEDVAADKRKAVQRLVAVIQQMFLKDDSLIGLLGFKKTETAKGDDLVTSLVESIKEVWEAHRNAAIKQKDEVKRRVNQIVKVEALGGTWRHVDDIFLQIDGEISDQLAAIIGQEGEARSKAIEAVADTVRTNLGYLDGNNIVDLLDDPPFDVGQGAVGETLREGLSGVSDGLKRIEASSVAAAA
ncbi:hypothetical protein [Inquilinus sp. OTU3971]|uniref:hypothetical protein n=1 Tax=Inquilinus sp. OTU3971 TaxID=3043855 RepID=UPI00313B6CF1